MIPILLLLLFTIAAISVIQWTVSVNLRREKDLVTAINERYGEFMSVKESLDSQRKVLEAKVAEIFTLYDLTAEMTKTFSEERTFQTFKAKLGANANFTDCLLLDPLAQDEIKDKEPNRYMLLPLTGQRRKLGTLALKDVANEQKEKVTILAHQFALALRRVRLYQDIERSAITDGLTEVHTRRYVMERLEEERSRSQTNKTSMAFLMIDVDFFKSFNDQYGHLTGDQILREIAAILKTQIREIDIVGRYGGEEFCVILPDTDYSGAGYVAERIRTAVEAAMIKAYDTTTKATVSIGVALYPQDGKKISELIDKADWALYRAKKEGRNRVCAFGVYNK